MACFKTHCQLSSCFNIMDWTAREFYLFNAVCHSVHFECLNASIKYKCIGSYGPQRSNKQCNFVSRVRPLVLSLLHSAHDCEKCKRMGQKKINLRKCTFSFLKLDAHLCTHIQTNRTHTNSNKYKNFSLANSPLFHHH